MSKPKPKAPKPVKKVEELAKELVHPPKEEPTPPPAPKSWVHIPEAPPSAPPPRGHYISYYDPATRSTQLRWVV